MASSRAQARKRQILAEIARLDFFLPGSLVERTTRCGTATCRCQTDPALRHGPYPSWIRKAGNKSLTRTMSATQAERYRSWFDNNRRLKQLIEELQQLSVDAINEAEGWPGVNPDPASDTPENMSTTRRKCG